ncbi:MAG: VCBS repeat-containing protein, partial [Planctomycetes bacterium]|nr:VCBS repeat-containing protein [Planctomycetota bacterium]
GDGDADLVVGNIYSDNISVLLNNGDGTFAADVLYGAGDYPHSVAIGDLDGDGDADLAVSNLYGDDVSILLNNGDGTFAADVLYGTGDFSTSVAIGDLDGDGVADLAVANGDSNNISILLNQCRVACEGDANGDGLVDPLDSGFVLARFGCDVGAGDPDCDTADMNGDGLVDPLDVGYIVVPEKGIYTTAR